MEAMINSQAGLDCIAIYGRATELRSCTTHDGVQAGEIDLAGQDITRLTAMSAMVLGRLETSQPSFSEYKL
jgi:hypothetical protein